MKFTWNPITTAPLDADLELCVYDGEEYVGVFLSSQWGGLVRRASE